MIPSSTEVAALLGKMNRRKHQLLTSTNDYGDLLVQCLGSTNCIFNVKVCNTEEATYSHYKPKCKPKQVLQKRKRNRNSSTYSHAWISDVTSPLLSSQGRASSSMKHKYGKGHHSENDGTLGCSKEWQIAKNITRGGSFHVPNPLDFA